MSLKPISVTTSTITLDRDVHQDTIVSLDRAAGVTVTLPAASGSGDTYNIVVGTTITSNSGVIQVANTSDVMMGSLVIATDIAGVTVPTTATSDTITMNGSTTGGVLGSYVRLTDFATNKWLVTGSLVSTGAEATPFSAAV